MTSKPLLGLIGIGRLWDGEELPMTRGKGSRAKDESTISALFVSLSLLFCV
jgi:hypothetical protein